jgi:hypothetical protein
METNEQKKSPTFLDAFSLLLTVGVLFWMLGSIIAFVVGWEPSQQLVAFIAMLSLFWSAGARIRNQCKDWIAKYGQQSN